MERCVCVCHFVSEIFYADKNFARKSMELSELFFSVLAVGNFLQEEVSGIIVPFRSSKERWGWIFFYSSLRKVCEGKKSYFLWTDIGCATYFAFIEVTELSELVFFFMRAMERVEGYRHWSRIFYLINSSINLTDLTTIIGIESISHFFSVAR